MNHLVLKKERKNSNYDNLLIKIRSENINTPSETDTEKIKVLIIKY